VSPERRIALLADHPGGGRVLDEETYLLCAVYGGRQVELRRDKLKTGSRRI
jgi:hypothetical protein